MTTKLISCTDCGAQISRKAAACPSCGAPGGFASAQRVIVRDVNMEFGTMIAFMVKAAIAAIPAVVILALIFLVVGKVLFRL